MNPAINAIIPLLILISLGFLSRRFGILKAGDERVLSAYVYYFALPSLFLVAISEVKFTEEMVLFILSGVLPIIILVGLYATIYAIFGIKRETFFLLSLSTIFGSLAFFGIPFIIFALPESETMASLQAAMVSIVAVSMSITLLEIYSTNENLARGFSRVAKKLSKNPLIISILIGLFFSFSGIKIPSLILSPLHMLGRSTSVVAIFMLGVFLYGRKYGNIKLAFALSMLRIFLLPFITFLLATLLRLPKNETMIAVLMNAMPMAISMIVLSHRYKFYEDVIASIIMISSLAAIAYLNIWFFVLS
ncbi:MAG: AEC family transporter [Thermoplasmata archaeon]|nr:AEC family transporter [Thermoplasmata archaeon]